MPAAHDQAGEAALFDAWRRGDRQAGQALLGLHLEDLRRFFRGRAKDRSDDLVQQTALRCIESRDRFRRQSTFRTYLYGIAHNVVREDRRRHQPKPDEVPQDLIDPGELPDMRLHARIQGHCLARALKQIPDHYRLALKLYYWDGYTGSQLANMLGLGIPGVRSRLRRATAALRAQLTE